MIRTLLYFTSGALIMYSNFAYCDKNLSQIWLLSEGALKKLQNFIGGRKDEINKFRNLIKQKSSCVVLIYTISNDKSFNNIASEHKACAFYNSAVKPRNEKSDYKYGVTSGIVISNSGLVVTTYDGTKNSDRYIVAIDSEKNKEDNEYGEITIKSNMYEAHVVKSFPGLNIVLLQLEKKSNEEFDYLNIANDSFFRDANGNNLYLIYNAVTIGKCKGDHFVRQSLPFNTRNRFDMKTLVIGGVSYVKNKGIPTLVMSTPVTGDGALPENHGGALINGEGKLIGMPVWNGGITLPYTYAIPASTIKKCIAHAMNGKNSNTEISYGLEVKNLNKHQKNLLLKVLKVKFKDLDEKFLEKLQNKQISNEFSSAKELIINNNLGVVVDSVKINSPAELANIKQGDILLKINDDYILDEETFHNIENHSIDMAYITVTLLRKNNIITLEMRI